MPFVPQEEISEISHKFPSYRHLFKVSFLNYLKGKRLDDEAEGLWRIYDTLYDFTDFIDRHPGGAFWLNATKGTDITYQFEAHHITTIPEKMLAKYEVRKASQPSNYTLTLHEDGFYRTLKRRFRERLPELDTSCRKTSERIHLGLLISTVGFSLATAYSGMWVFILFAGLSMCWFCIATHNYLHQKDNWQMYTFNLTMMNFESWRISHALSHHFYPNTYHDLELAIFEPLLCWVPNSRIASKMTRIASVCIQPILYLIVFKNQFIQRVRESIMHSNVLYWHDAIGFILPLLMVTVSNASFLATIIRWMAILACASFIFAIIAINGAHHAPKIYHEGDAFREDRDWGLFQVDTLIDRKDIKGSQFFVLTFFGEHALHHLFPTLDHGILPQLYPIFFQTLEEFNCELRESTQWEQIIGQNKQLLRTEPNPIAPGSKFLD